MIRLPVVSAPPGSFPVNANCGRCSAICCNYISTEIDVPTTKKDLDIIRWYLIHPGVRVYCEDSSGSWFVQFMSRCRYLRDDNLCGIYETRPQICRDLDPTLCEFALGAGDRFLFTNVEEFERWRVEREHQRQARRRVRATRNGGKRRAVEAPRGRARRRTPVAAAAAARSTNGKR